MSKKQKTWIALAVAAVILIVVAIVVWVDVIKGLEPEVKETVTTVEVVQTCKKGCVQYKTLVCDEESRACQSFIVDACVDQSPEGVCYTWEVSRIREY